MSDDNGKDNPLLEFAKDMVGGLAGMFTKHTKDLLTVLRQPTPLNITVAFTSNAAGQIGGGLATPDPVTLFQCPMSHEAWVNRIAITSPQYRPTTPLTTGQAYCTGSTANELIFFLPVSGQIAPLLITEGRLSAAQLNEGERMLFSADTLPPNITLKFDLQIVLVTGISVDTPQPRDSGRVQNVNLIG